MKNISIDFDIDKEVFFIYNGKVVCGPIIQLTLKKNQII